MEAGKLRHRVSIDSKVEVQDGQGGVEVSWLVWAENVPAAIEPVSGRELLATNQILARSSAKITIRWREGVVPTMRVRHGDTVYNIEAVLPDRESGRVSITLLVSTGTNDG